MLDDPLYIDDRFNNLDTLLETTASFWKDLYAGSELVADYLRGATVQEQQIGQTAGELYATINRFNCPLHHVWSWLPIVLSATDARAGRPVTYGGPYVFSGPILFGGSTDSSTAFPLPAEIVTAPLMADAILFPTVLMAAGNDFFVNAEASQLVFAVNPFIDPRFQPYTDTDGSLKLRVYLFAAAAERSYLANTWGPAAGALGASTANYKNLVNAILDASVQGGTLDTALRAITAVTDIPLAAGNETVENVGSDSEGMLVITDQNVYRFASSAAVLVSAGDVLVYGQNMTDGLAILPTGRGIVPAGMTSLTLDNHFLWQGISGPLTFQNEALPLTVVGVVNGYTQVTFPIGGASSDVTAFFTEMHRRGVAAGKALANWLDIRANPTSQPTAANLPATINPLKMLMANELRSNLLMVQVDTSQLGPNNLPIDLPTALRNILSPHTGLLLVEV